MDVTRYIQPYIKLGYKVSIAPAFTLKANRYYKAVLALHREDECLFLVYAVATRDGRPYRKTFVRVIPATSCVVSNFSIREGAEYV
jgi:hypothetical protein